MYSILCKNLRQNGYDTITVRDYLESPASGRFAIMRHDVDRTIKNALKMAELENRLGIRSTYYFRYPYTFEPEIIKKIGGLGHEIGYHYEVLSKARGDYGLAIRLFESELEKIRKIADVKTICMHGYPLSKYDNRHIWNKYCFRDFGIIGEAYLSFRGDAAYLSDTGRTWSSKNKIRDFMPGYKSKDIATTTDNLIRALNKGNTGNLYILAHPERWGYTRIDGFSGYLRDLVVNAGKKMLVGLR